MIMKKFVNVVSLMAIGVIIASIGCDVRWVDAFVNEIDIDHLYGDLASSQNNTIQPYVDDAHPSIELIFTSNDDKELTHGIFTTEEPCI